MATSFDGYYDFIDALPVSQATSVARVLATNYLLVATQDGLKVVLFKEKQFNEICKIGLNVVVAGVSLDDDYVYCTSSDGASLVVVQMGTNLLKLI